MLKEVLRRFYEAQESYIMVNEKEIKPEEFDSPLPLFVRVLLTNGKRKRFVNLGVLSRIYIYCPWLRDFVRDFLDLSLSLQEVFERHCILTEWEALSLCPEDALKGESKDYLEVLSELRVVLESRDCWREKRMS